MEHPHSRFYRNRAEHFGTYSIGLKSGELVLFGGIDLRYGSAIDDMGKGTLFLDKGADSIDL